MGVVAQTNKNFGEAVARMKVSAPPMLACYGELVALAVLSRKLCRCWQKQKRGEKEISSSMYDCMEFFNVL